MIKAILSGAKTQTRRVVKPQPDSNINPVQIEDCWQWATAESRRRCPYGEPGDKLWTRETFALENAPGLGSAGPVAYRADCDREANTCPFPRAEYGVWKPSIHMPRAFSRITLEITGVRVERLNEISKQDAIAEGLEPVCHGWKDYRGKIYNGQWWENPVNSYRTLWESIHGAGSWALDPWVFVIEFRRVETV